MLGKDLPSIGWASWVVGDYVSADGDMEHCVALFGGLIGW